MAIVYGGVEDVVSFIIKNIKNPLLSLMIVIDRFHRASRIHDSQTQRRLCSILFQTHPEL